MAKVEDMGGYLREHVYYEWAMLNATCDRAFQSRNSNDQVGQNAFMESFWLHSRTLFDFLRGEGTQNDIKSTSYIPRYKMTRRSTPGDQLLQRLNDQITHLSQRREDAIKLDLGAMTEVVAWLNDEMCIFRSTLPDPSLLVVPQFATVRVSIGQMSSPLGVSSQPSFSPPLHTGPHKP